MPREQRTDMTPGNRLGKRNGVFIVYFICLLLSVARVWRYMNAAERRLQVILTFPMTIATITSTVLPESTYERYRTPALILCRFTAAILPSFKVLLRRNFESDTYISMKWGQNRLGTIGLVLFSSRGLILGVSSMAMPLDFLPTLLVQILIGAASWPTNLGLCSAKIASAPEILLWLNAIHSFFSILWGVCMPFFWTPLPPRTVVHPGVSFIAVTFFVQFFAAGLPVVQSVLNESKVYWQQVARQQRQEVMTSQSIGNSNLSSNTSNDDDNDEDFEYTEGYDRRNASSNTAAPNLTNNTENFDNENRPAAGTSAIEYYSLPPSFPSPSSAVCPEYKGPPLAARICSYYQDVFQFPVHAVWLSVVVGSLLWTLSYTAAERMCF